MTVEERRGSSIGEDDASKDRFPVGMRVLAVDDDPTCLKFLETLLRHCDYHVTTTGQAVTALKMLRENKDKFDLVISDVHMPDMDGFKLLELVGLEMDLPVIMLSANSDTKAVMKGITHGACDYLVKPVRIEELKNIWQHVIRRRKIDPKDHSNSGHGDDEEKMHHGMGDGGPAPVMAGSFDPNGKHSKKRKDQSEDDDDEYEENGHDNEDPSAQKKPRVVWSVDLHQKFVAAVNQLGIDKAVPKRILDIMNVDRLTRENVASHLQKYRLYLKRISSVASQQANIAAALGAKDLSYLHMGSLDGLGEFHALGGSGQLPKAAISSFHGDGAFGRLNSPTGVGLHGLTSPGMIQLGRPQNSVNGLGNLQRATHPGNPHGNLLRGMPHSLELDHLQPNKPISCIGGLSSPVNDSTLFPVAHQRLAGIGGFSHTGVATCSSSNSFLNIPNNSLLQGHPQQGLSGGLGSQSSVTMATLNTEPLDVNAAGPSHLPAHGRCNDTWQSAAPLAGYSANLLPMGASFNHDDLSLANIPPISSHIEISPLNVSPSSMVAAAPLHELLARRDPQCQASSLGVSVQHMSREIDENVKFSNFGRMGNGVGQNMNYTQKQLEDHKQDYNHNPNIVFSSPLNSFLPNHGIMGTMGQSLGQNNAACNRKMEMTLMGQSNSGTSFNMQRCDVGKSNNDGLIKFKEDYLLEHPKLPGGFNPNSFSSFDDLMSAMIKREQDEVPFMDGDTGCDVFSLGMSM